MKKLQKEQKSIFLITFIAALSGLLFGYDTGVISGALLFIQKEFSLSTFSTEMLVAAVLLGACGGAVISGKLADYLGRRKLMLIAGIAFAMGTLLSAVGGTIANVIEGRIIVGFAIGIASYAAPLYIAEIAPKRTRGAFVILNTITVTGGIVLAYVSDLLLEHNGSWRWMFGLGLIPALLLIVGIFGLPESPRWAAKKGWMELARYILTRIRPLSEVEEELNEIKRNLSYDRTSSWAGIFDPQVRKILLLGIGLAIVQQITGINTIFYYAPSIFQLAGFESTTAQLFATLGMGVTNFVMTIIAMLWVDRVGRRPLLLIGLGMMTLLLFLVATIFNGAEHTAGLRWLLVGSLILFVAFYALSIGCLFWLIVSEVFPLQIRGAAMSIATMSNWAANLIVALTFLSLIKLLGPGRTFLFYGVAGLLSFVFALLWVPETKNVSLEHIENNLNLGKRCRELGNSSV